MTMLLPSAVLSMELPKDKEKRKELALQVLDGLLYHYLANPGTEHEFVSTLTAENGGTTHTLWHLAYRLLNEDPDDQ